MSCAICALAHPASPGVCTCGATPPASTAAPAGWLLANVRVLGTLVPVYEGVDRQSPLVTTLVAGDEARLVASTVKNGQRWVAVKLRGGREGYVPGDTMIYAYRWVRLQDEEVTAHEHPSAVSQPRRRYRTRAQFRIIDTVESASGTWVKLRDPSGGEGFIPGTTRVQHLQDGRI